MMSELDFVITINHQGPEGRKAADFEVDTSLSVKNVVASSDGHEQRLDSHLDHPFIQRAT